MKRISHTAFYAMTRWQFALAVFAMGLVVVGSNVLVQYPINRC